MRPRDAVGSYVAGNDGAGVLEPRQVTGGSVDQHNIRVRGLSTPRRRLFDVSPTDSQGCEGLRVRRREEVTLLFTGLRVLFVQLERPARLPTDGSPECGGRERGRWIAKRTHPLPRLFAVSERNFPSRRTFLRVNCNPPHGWPTTVPFTPWQGWEGGRGRGREAERGGGREQGPHRNTCQSCISLCVWSTKSEH